MSLFRNKADTSKIQTSKKIKKVTLVLTRL